MVRTMALVSRLDTPGSLRDLPDGSPLYDNWHELVSGLINSVAPAARGGDFFNPSAWNFEPDAHSSFPWMGFPRPHLVVENRDDRDAAFRSGEDRDAQHEYLEWHVTKADGKITKVVFVTETPEYWGALGDVDPDRVMDLYHELVRPNATRADVFPDGVYDPRNRWNHQDGIVHYIMGINSLGALIDTSQNSRVRRRARDNYDAVPLRFDRKTVMVTASDARFTLDIGTLTRKKLSVTVHEPVGLYMLAWDDTGWAKPDGTPVDDYWRVARGAPGAALRLEYEVPADEDFVVGDITIGGRPVEYGGQLAEHITVMAGGIAGKREA
jgi:hypothetical protein